MKSTKKQKASNKKIQKISKNTLESIDFDESIFYQEEKLSHLKFPNNKKKRYKQSNTLAKPAAIYGGSTPRKQPDKNFSKKVQAKKYQSQFFASSLTKKKNQNDSSTKSIKFQNVFIDQQTTKWQNQSNQGKIFFVQSQQSSKQKQEQQKSQIKKEEVLDQQYKSKSKAKDQKPPHIQQNILSKERLKYIYNQSQILDQANNQAPQAQKIESQKLKIRSLHQIQNQNDYLTKITGHDTKLKQDISASQKINFHQYLAGKISIIWIFAIKSKLPKQIRNKINQMYNPLLQDDRAVPLVSNPKLIDQFVNIPNCYFKIVTDIQCAQKVIYYRVYNKVIQFQIWNQKGNQTLSKALQYKSISRKVKGIFTDWQKIIKRAEQQIQQQITIYKINNGLQKRKRQRKFPNFLKLTDTDKTEATLYRINLYGAIKLVPEQKKQNYEAFLNFIKIKYQKDQNQQQNIENYSKIDHLKPIETQQSAKQIINFYINESFYYKTLNSMLRTMKTSEQFKLCNLPFHETYHSVRLYYQHFIQQSNGQIQEMTLYRGCKMLKKDFNQLKKGVFIQIFGFMSTTKTLEKAFNFTDGDRLIFRIHVKKRKINNRKLQNFDHGFVDINRYSLAPKQYQKEEQVLFNALNVYQVMQIQEIDNYKYIHLQYGVIFDLIQKPKESLTQDQYETLVNYHYCTMIQGKIQDQGDVFLFANQLPEAKEYYSKKINQGANLAHNYYKLANVQKQCGQIDKAEANANKALKLFGNQINLNDKQTCLKVFGIHSKNAEINIEKQDYLTADNQIDKALNLLSDEQLFEKGIKLRERGEIKFKKGQIKNAQNDFKQSEQIFQNIKTHAQVRKIAAYQNYYCSHLSLLCSEKTRIQLKNDLNGELTKIQEMKQKISQINESIVDEVIKINKSLKDVSLYVQDRQKYQIYVKKAQGYLLQLKEKKANDPEIKAKLLSMQAMVNDYQELAESQKLLNEAIKLVESKNPFDIKVADYSKMLAKIQKSELQRYTNPTKKIIKDMPKTPIPYDEIERKGIYQRCKQNFTKTLNVLLYHAKDTPSPEILDIRNQLGQLTFTQNDYSQCEKILIEARKSNSNFVHSEMAKTLVIMAKIYFARGQLKNSFQTLKEAHQVLEEAMVNKHRKQGSNNLQKYKNIFKNSDTYLSIHLIQANIFHKQKNHDLALKNINLIEQVIKIKVGLRDSHPLLADILELKGLIEVFKGNIYDFDDFFEKTISLREKQFGHYHPVNAKTYCTYAKCLIMVKDIKSAGQKLEKAVEILSAFEQGNPHYWAIYYLQGYFNENHLDYSKSQFYYDKSLKWAEKYFNKSHIAIKQVMLRYANLLNKSKKIKKSMDIYEKLQQQLDDGIRQSNKRNQLNQQIDDEKISLKKLMYSQLTSHLGVNQLQRNQTFVQTSNTDSINTSLFKSKLNLLRNTYRTTPVRI